jgi:hypothetical protein
MGPIGCPETSLTNYQPTLRNVPKSEDPMPKVSLSVGTPAVNSRLVD